MNRHFPRLVFSNSNGEILDHPHLATLGRSGRDLVDIDPASLIPLPENSRLYFLPGRSAVGRDPVSGEIREVEGANAVAAFLPPAYTIFLLAGFAKRPDAEVPLLPLYAYSAVCWYRGKFYVPAVRIDDDVKHDPAKFSIRRIESAIQKRRAQFPNNRLIEHHGVNCALRYQCPNAQNYFLNRWEAPIAVSAACNAACVGCISEQPKNTVPSSQERLTFVPTVEEIVEIAVPHLDAAPRAIVSFGQGCEGEPLLQAELIDKAIHVIRRRTSGGTIHLNTNGSHPKAVQKLIDAGLDSIRVSLNSARDEIYMPYYQPRGYSFSDVRETIHLAVKAGIWTSINYLSFPGVTDQPAEFVALCELIDSSGLNMIQWRNLNIDPDWYLESIGQHQNAEVMGMPVFLKKIKEKFPDVRFGYFNPPKESWTSSKPAAFI
jgi:pyruvate-formate lyase-activating enzyme